MAGPIPTILARLPWAVTHLNPMALAVGLASFALVMLYPKRWNFLLPAPLVALVVVSGASVLWLPSGALPRLGAMPTGLPALQWPQVGWGICAPWGASR